MKDVLVIKKNGSMEKFDIEKIYKAISFAEDRSNCRLDESNKKYSYMRIKQEIGKNFQVKVDFIHNVVIKVLEEVEPRIAREYEKYRDYKERFNKTFLNIQKSTRGILENGDKENANKDSRLISTKKELISGVVSKEIALDYELSEEWSKAHREGDIQIHDLTDYIYNSFNCCLFDMGGLLKDGFLINGIKKKEPNSIKTAISLMSDVILSASSQQFGGFTVPEVDVVLSPYVEKSFRNYREMINRKVGFLSEEEKEKWVEELVYSDIRQGIESVEHRLNTINNSNGQTSFTTFSFGLSVSKYGRMIIKALLDVRNEGLGENKVTAIFPKFVFLVRDEINKNKDSINHDLYLESLKVSMRRMYPDYLSLNSGYLGEVYDKYGKAISPMGCRSFLNLWFNEKGEAVFVGRANCGVVSLNLVRYAIKSNGDVFKFYELIDKYLEMAINIHLYKFEKLRKQKASSNPLFFTQGGCHMRLDPEDCIEEVIRTFSWSIGFIGLDEVSRYFTGYGISRNIDNKNNSKFVKKILEYLNYKIDQYKEKYGLLFSLYGTPAESMCYRLLQLDREEFGEIRGVTDKNYYTNSFHIRVGDKINGIQKQKIESELFHLCKGGRIVYNEYPNNKNFEAIKSSVDFAMNLGLYKGINMQLDSCLDCNFEGEFIGGKCSKCGSKNILEVNRVCGYLGYKNRMNKGKLSEIEDRVDHY